MATPAEIKELLKEVVDADPNLPITGTVKSLEGDSCTVNLGDIDITDVKLRATLNENDDYVVFRPKVGSSVLMLSLSGRTDNLTVVKVDQLDSMDIKMGDIKLHIDSQGIKINGDNFGGIVKAGELKNQVDKNTAVLKSIQQAFSSWSVAQGDGGSVLKGLSSSFANMQRADLSHIENEKVKHGQ